MDQQTESKISFKNQIKELSNSVEGNNFCADCGISKVSWASVNHGLFLCLDCALNHKTYFTSKESTIKSLDMPYWSSNEVDILKIGGNYNFHHFLEYYGIDKYEKDLISKYKNKAVQFYKIFIKSQSEGSDIDFKRPNKEDGLILIKEEIQQPLSQNELNQNQLIQDLRNEPTYSYSQLQEEKVYESTIGNQSHTENENNTTAHVETDISKSIVQDIGQYMNEGFKLVSEVNNSIRKEFADGTLKETLKENAVKAKDYIFTEAPKVKNTIISSAKGFFSSIKERFVGKPEEPIKEDELITKLSKDYIEANNIECIDLEKDNLQDPIIVKNDKVDENGNATPKYMSSYKEI